MLRPWMLSSAAASTALCLLTGVAAAQQPAPPPAPTAPGQPAVPPPSGYGKPAPGYPQQQGYPQQYPPQQQYPQQQGYPQQQYPQQQQGYPQQQYPQQQGYPQQQYPQQQGYSQQGYPDQRGYGPPGYPQPGYGQPGNGFTPPAGPPPPPAPKAANCCRWSVRFDPFDLLFRRLTFQVEVAVIGPLTLELTPAWIFDSPSEGLTEKGFSFGGNITFYLSGKAFQGMWLKAHLAYESYTATFTNPFISSTRDPALFSSAPTPVSTGVFGAMIGSTSVFGRDGGFVISGGIGIGAATADTVSIVAPGSPLDNAPPVEIKIFDKIDRIKLLGSLGLGVAF